MILELKRSVQTKILLEYLCEIINKCSNREFDGNTSEYTVRLHFYASFMKSERRADSAARSHIQS